MCVCAAHCPAAPHRDADATAAWPRPRRAGRAPELFENLLELRPELGEAIAVKADFFGWALKRLQNRAFDQNKQYTSELLAILLQTSKGTAAPEGGEGSGAGLHAGPCSVQRL